MSGEQQLGNKSSKISIEWVFIREKKGSLEDDIKQLLCPLTVKAFQRQVCINVLNKSCSKTPLPLNILKNMHKSNIHLQDAWFEFPQNSPPLPTFPFSLKVNVISVQKRLALYAVRADWEKKMGAWRTPELDRAHLPETSLKRRSGDGWRHLEAPAASACVQTCLSHVSEERRKTAFLLATALIKRLGVSPLGRSERLSPLPVIYKQHTSPFPIEMISRWSSEASLRSLMNVFLLWTQKRLLSLKVEFVNVKKF